MNKCLYCYKQLLAEEQDFHAGCSKKIFGRPTPPELDYSESEMENLAKEIVRSQIALTGVQPKISLELSSGKAKREPARLTIVGLWGGYILKPPTVRYAQLPEVEDLTMHLAAIAKIGVVPHCLVRLTSGNLAYITKRIDREVKTKIHMEDMCQLTEKLTEDKYHGSYEQVAKTILKYSVNPGLDVVNFFELVLFSFLTGNADMHLKNFSLIHHPGIGPVLAPAYDLVATALVNPADDEDCALTLNGKKKKLRRKDFVTAFTTLRLDAKQQENIFGKMLKVKDKWIEFVETSFLTDDYKERYKQLVLERFGRIYP